MGVGVKRGMRAEAVVELDVQVGEVIDVEAKDVVKLGLEFRLELELKLASVDVTTCTVVEVASVVDNSDDEVAKAARDDDGRSDSEVAATPVGGVEAYRNGKLLGRERRMRRLITNHGYRTFRRYTSSR